MPTNARDARRRRILQGSQDRLNLITGRVTNIPSSDSQTTFPDIIASDDETDVAPALSPPLISRDLDPLPRLSDHHLPDKLSDKTVFRHDEVIVSNENDSFGVGSREETNLRKRGTSNDFSKASSSEVRVKSESSPSPAIQRQSIPTTRHEQFLASLFNVFGPVTSQQLNSAISSTEQSRRILSITMALLVLLSYFGFPIVGNKVIKSIILFRPFFLLLLMNISLVVLRIQADLDQGPKDPHKSSGFEGLGASEGLNWAAEAGRALEVGLMLQNVFGSLFMDFGVYALIIICGFCLAG